MKKFLVAAALAVSAVASFSPAQALDRIGWSKTRETMYLHGEIEPGDTAKVYAAIRKNNRRLRGVILNSPGGEVFEGIKLAAMMKHYQFDAGVAKGGVCASACFMVWSAGQTRYVYADSRVAIHSATAVNAITGESGENVSSFATTLMMARIYHELRVPLYLIGTMIVTPPETYYELNAQDLQYMQARVMQ
jgi:hypothetical protein